MLAIGFIETKGMIPAIEAADAMLKAADVRLLEKNLVGGGLVTITVAGEVSAVQASVDAAVACISRIQGATLVSRHVIPRPDGEISRILATSPRLENVETPESHKEDAALAEPGPEADGKAVFDAPSAVLEHSDPAPADPDGEQRSTNMAQLKKMSLNKVRQFARTVEGIALTRQQISVSGKKILLEAIENAYRQMKE